MVYTHYFSTPHPGIMPGDKLLTGYDHKVGVVQQQRPIDRSLMLPYTRHVEKAYWGNIGHEVLSWYSLSHASRYGLLSAPFDVDTNAWLQLQQQLGALVRGHDFDPSISIGEGRESLGTLGVNTHKMSSDLPARRKSGRGISMSASDYLNIRFGWIPLLRDLSSLMQMIANDGLKRSRTYRASTRRPFFARSPNPGVVEVSGNGTVTYYAVAKLVDSPSVYTGISDVASTIWGLTPYSFVADWVLPVSTYLAARRFSSLPIAQSCYGWIAKGSFRTVTVFPDENTFVSDEQSLKTMRHQRFVGSIPLPLPRSKPLSEVFGPSNWNRALDGLFLLGNRLGGLNVRL